MIDIIDRLSFDATRCEIQFSKGVATNIEDGIAEIKKLRAALKAITYLGGKNDLPDAWKIAHAALDQ